MPRITAISQIDIDVGQRMLGRRKLLGMTQSALAEGLGITFQQIQKYEKGTNRVGSSRLQHIATILGTTPSALFGEQIEGVASTIPELEAIDDVLGSAEGLALNKAFVAIKNPAIRKSIVSLVKVLAEDE